MQTTNGNLLDRMRLAVQRTADRVSGRHVPVVNGAEPLGDLQGRAHATPPVDILENDGEILIRADVPGATTDNAHVHWDDGVLHLHVQVEPVARGRAVLEEWAPRDWYRAFRLPAHADGAQARCTVRHGILEVHVPKRAPKPVRIPVRTEG